MAHDRLGGDAEDPELARFRRQQARRMLDFAEAPGCRHRLLAAHFDERIDPCGTACDRCDAGMAGEARRPGEAVPPGASRIRKAVAPGRRRSAEPEAGPAGPLFDDTAPDAEALLLRLKAWRRRAAQARGTPPFLVFPDAALKAIAAARPRTPDELGGVKGVGPAKLAAFGAQVLAEIAAHGAGGEAAEAIRGEAAG
jgi:ATP-dependent DNA helicase RecQ